MPKRLFSLPIPASGSSWRRPSPTSIDPVAIRFDEDGRMWVVRDARLSARQSERAASRCRGSACSKTATAMGGSKRRRRLPTSCCSSRACSRGRAGVFVTLSGRLAYMKDTDGDGRADVDETWFEGFAELNTQLRANHPRLALDNWIYVANGLRGGKVVNKKLGETEPINISGMDFRFDPLTGKAEAVTGNGQFGLCFDDWGNRFNCSNRNPVRHVVIEDRYLKANPGVTVPATVNDVAASGEQSRIFPISRAWTTSNLHAGQFTAACGVYIYRGDLLPAEFKGNVFTCDPTGNLIHREIMQPAGPTFTSKPAYEGKEFLASPDEWFRPVNMELGPDGALYVVDMYRCVIEHPDFVPDELKRRPDLRLGDDRGRIWRIASERPGPAAQARESTSPPRSKRSSEDLLSLLEHPNAWQRETAQRLLLERGVEPLADSLKQFVTQSSSPNARAHALQLLASAGALQRNELVSALSDRDEHVRRQALLSCEVAGRPAAVRIEMQSLEKDQAAAVRFQARLTGSSAETGLLPQGDALAQDANDPWMRRSLLLAFDRTAGGGVVTRLAGFAGGWKKCSDGELVLIEELSELSAASDDGRRGARLVQAATAERAHPQVGLAVLRGCAKVWNRKGPPARRRLPPIEFWPIPASAKAKCPTGQPPSRSSRLCRRRPRN